MMTTKLPKTMTNRPSHSTAEEKKRRLKSRFLLSGVAGIILISIVFTVVGYALLHAGAQTSASQRVSAAIQQAANNTANASSRRRVIESGDNTATQTTGSSSKAFTLLGARTLRVIGVDDVAFFDPRGQLIWSSTGSASISDSQQAAFNRLASGRGDPYQSYGNSLLDLTTWTNIVLNDYRKTDILVGFTLTDGSRGVAKAMVDNRPGLAAARGGAGYLILILVLSSGFLFALLYMNFLRGLRTINEQEETLNHQIAKLSSLLKSNKDMQKSMKTASARAVKLNEQFLRRLGADLHDGPAQMIGFAVMRLNQVSKHEAAKQLSHEFHAVRDALDESLEDIRNISSGLVLPELEQMSLEECLRKVVTLHGTKSDAEIEQFYQELPDKIPLPIKICTYRFIQEGLNNADRHGKAKKCRINAFVKDDVLHLSLKDNGAGFRKSTLKTDGDHLGLLGLNDRIESLGGKFSINSELGVGTTLKLSVSLKDDS